MNQRQHLQHLLLGLGAGALGDSFGPGTTVGIPFAAQIGARITF